ncbi:MAG: UvrD-helicase domain-containing protein, partial [Acidobacteria bacterium]|nr:UvrD-helicase domain-containing protein [Acidobacteriota bacterium]
MSELQQLMSFTTSAGRSVRRNLVIEAGAGTGKTTAIVAEVLRIMLEDAELSPERIVLVTFTEKAAGEIADRVHDALEELAERGDGEVSWPIGSPNPLLVMRADPATIAKQLARIDSLRSQTIHSFCQMLLRQFPLEAGLDPQFKIVEGFERTLLYSQLYDAWVDEETRVHPSKAVEEEWEFLVAHFGYLFQIRDAIFELVERRDLVTDDYPLGDASVLLRGIPEAIATLRRGEVGRISRYLQNTAAPESDATLDAWIEFFGPLAQDIRETDLPRGGKNAEFAEALKVLRSSDKKGSSILDRLVGHRAATALHTLTRRFLAFLDTEKRKLGVVDFDDLLLRTLAVLHDDAVLERARAQYDFLFVDEFQDTDRTQARILDRLARDRSGSYVQGKTVIVGDPKQSIYAFRRADPEMYFEMSQRLIADGGAEHRIIRDQYRSDRPLLDAVNAIFLRLFPVVDHDRDVFRPPYHALNAGKAKDARELDARITVLRACEEEKGEALAVAEWIESHRGDTPDDLKRFAILFRRTTRLDDYLDALDRYGIEYVLPPTRRFLDRRAPVDLLAVLRAIGFPFDRGAEISAARTPYFALTDDEIVERGEAWEAYRATLAKYRAEAAHLDVASLIDFVVATANIEEVYGAAADGVRAQKHLEHVRAIAFEYDQKIGGSVRQFVDEIERRRGEPDEMEPSLTDESRNAVRILTVHAAKGLEFDTVILPDLSFAVRSPDVYALEEPSRLVMITPPTVTADDVAKKIGKEKEEAETQRLFYVAVTRAKSEVVFVCGPEARKQGFAKCLLEVLPIDWRAEGREVRETEIGPVAFETVTIRDSVTRTRRRLLDAAMEAQLREGEILPLALDEPSPIAEPLSAEEIARERARGRNRAAGILLHRVLERWNGRGDVEGMLSVLAKESGVDADSVARVRARLATVAKSAMFQRIANAETLGRELALRFVENGNVVERRIDRLIRENGAQVIIDYKSGTAEESRLEKDREQVRQYCAALAAISGEPCTGVL